MADVPALLRRLQREESAVWDLHHAVFTSHTGEEVTEVAAHATPLLLDYATSPGLPHRAELLRLLVDILHADPERHVFTGPEPDFLVRARAAMASAADRIAGVLDDADSETAATAAYLLSCLSEAAVTSIPALRARAERGRAAADPAAISTLAVALLGATEHRAWFAELLRTTPHADVRAAAAAGLALADGEDPADTTGPDGVSTREMPHPVAVRATAAAEAAAESAFTRIAWRGRSRTALGAAIRHAEHWHRAVARDLLSGRGDLKNALFTAREAIYGWRAAGEDLVPLIAARARDVRTDDDLWESCVFSLAESGRALAPHADLLASMLTGDPTGPWPYHADKAVEALAYLGDPRSVPWVAAALLHDDPSANLDFQAVLTALAPQAEALIPALLTLLEDPLRYPKYRWLALDIFRGLLAFGTAAAPLAPALAARMDEWAFLALPVLAAAGTGAVSATSAIERQLAHPDHRDRTAFALWRVTGDPGEAPRILIEKLAGHTTRDIAPMLASLGPAAAAAVPRLRTLLVDEEWAHLVDHVAVARALWAITGDPTGLIAPLVAAVGHRPLAGDDYWWGSEGLDAVEGLGLMGPAAAEAIPALTAIATGRARVTERDVWTDERYQGAARRALDAIVEAG